MVILVTGGAGYIGSHTCLELINAGYELIVLDNFSNSNIVPLHRIYEITGKHIKFYHADLLNKNSIEKIFMENKIDAVIHLAGYKSVGQSVQSPLSYYHNNVTGTLFLCQTMQKFNVTKMVFSSSATVYSINEGAISEDAQLGSSNPYGRTKLMIEEILKDLYVSDNNWSISILRYFNPVGAHSSGRLGEESNGIPNNLMPYITQVAIGKLEQLQIFGGDYPTPDGTGIRDYIHVMDLAAGHIRAIERVMTSTGVKAYNLGTGNGYSVMEMIIMFSQVSGRKIPYTIVDRRPGDVAVCYADPSMAKRELFWEAERGIEEMCEDAWRWQLINPSGYKEIVRKI
ncbi:UDP-glucose 4-epimerase GalE [Paenibacillus sp. JDR-2]|uniref:UDP-glucose 4-epimerase GalE n=1 Tax=Paenibacillus sp. (strain JDR-2) TaxID=324057 RepID=UPI0001667C4E|nr:UDP-glucose 4-epimerase GalE [Paenibacillus sp. JDR-2]ACT04359.1 UDP-glucose 4-epimerase [Paenibacillus sp. JDR-2]